MIFNKITIWHNLMIINGTLFGSYENNQPGDINLFEIECDGLKTPEVMVSVDEVDLELHVTSMKSLKRHEIH